MSKMGDAHTPLETSNAPTPGDSKNMKRAVTTMDIQTVGSEMLGQVSKFLFFLANFVKTCKYRNSSSFLSSV